MTAWHASTRFVHASDSLSLSRTELGALFPTYVIVARDWRILSVGPALQDLLGEWLIGSDLRATFRTEFIGMGGDAEQSGGEVILDIKEPGPTRLRGRCLEREDHLVLLVEREKPEPEQPVVPEVARRSDVQSDDANRAKSAFLATMSHEIRTPMNGVLGLASLLAETELTRDQRELVDTILNSGRALMEILNDVLDLSKIEAGSMSIECADFSLTDLLSGVEGLFRPMASSKRIGFHFANSVPHARLRGDAARIRQILFNLVGNAIKFTEEGEVSVEITFRPESGPRGTLVLRVVDSGIGIAPAAMEHIFEPFVQANSSTTRRFGGTGLGLAITRRLVDLLAGRIVVESRLDIGSTFEVEIPIDVSEAEPAPEPMKPAPLPDLSSLGARILVAEDNPTNRFLITRFLARLGVAMDCVENGHEAILAWEKGNYDLILMDVEMPVLDGLESSREIRRRERGRSARPVGIIGLSAETSAETRQAALSGGMDSFLTKPISIERLSVAIQHLLARPEEEKPPG